MDAEELRRTTREVPSQKFYPGSFGMSTIGDRLKEIRGDESQETFAGRFGIHRNTLARWESGERTPDLDFVIKMVLELGYSPEWVLTGAGPTRASAAAIHSAHQLTPDHVDLIQIPKVKARLSAGGGSFEINGEVERYYAFRSDWLRRKGNTAAMVLMDVSGQSMEPVIMDGDTILIDQSQTEPLPGRLYAVAVEELVYVKRVETKPGQLILRSENPAYDPIPVPTGEDMSDSVRILGRMIWSCREAK